MRRFMRSVCVGALTAAMPSTTPAQEPVEAVAPVEGKVVVDEMTVTASKRMADTQEIQISVEVFTGATVSEMRIRDVRDLSSFVPNFISGAGLSADTVVMRGIGSNPERSFEQSVALFADGVHMPRARQYAEPFLDVERVEVMRGPQSVLYGLNATGGAVSVVSRTSAPGDPLTFDLEADYELEYGGPTLTAVLGGSPSPNLGLRGAVKLLDTDGYYENTTFGADEGDTEQWAGRISAIWQPSDATTLTARLSHSDYEIGGDTGEIFGGMAALIEPGDGRLDWRRSSASSLIDPLQVLREDEPGVDVESTTLALELGVDVGPHRLTVIGGYTEFDYLLTVDVDSGSLPFFEGENADVYEQVVFEARIAAPADRPLTWMAGLYYQDSTLASDTVTIFGPVALPPGLALFESAQYDLDTEIASAYGQLSWQALERVRLTAGARYSDEDKRVVYSAQCRLGLLPDQVVPVPPELEPGCGFLPLDGLTDARNSDNLMPELSIEWDAAPDVLVYAKANRGVKAGGFAASNAGTLEGQRYDDETATGAEVGVRTRLREGRGQLNAALFYTDLDDLQVNSFVFDGISPQPRPVINNAATALSRGLEIDGRWAATRSLLVGASLGLLDAEFDSFSAAPCNTETAAQGVCDLSGQQLPLAPDWSANLFADLDRPLGERFSLLAGLNVSASDEYFTEGTLDPNAVQGSWKEISARLGVAARDRQWSLELVGRNLTDDVVLGSSVGLPTYFVGYIRPPRTVALRATFRLRG